MTNKIIFLLFILFATDSFGQDIHTFPRTKINGTDCYIYNVKAGDGWIRIRRRFGAGKQEILKFNPSATDKLYKGQILYIPVKNESATSSSVEFIEYEVKWGETVSGICEKYKIRQAELNAYNPSLKNGLKAGQILKIPVKSSKPPATKIPLTVNQPQRTKDSIGQRTTDSTKLRTTDSTKLRTTDSTKLRTTDSTKLRTTDSTKQRTADSTKLRTTDSTKQRILFFGDSMIEKLGKRMRQYAAENGHDLLNVIWYSSSTKWWAQHIDTLSYFIDYFHPTAKLILLCRKYFVPLPQF